MLANYGKKDYSKAMRDTRQTIIARIILAVLLIGALVFLAFRLIGGSDPASTSKDLIPDTKQPPISKEKGSDTAKAPESGDTKKPQTDKKTTSPPSAGTQTTPSPSTNTRTPAPAPGGSPSPATGATGQTGAGKNLTNSGPGSVAAIFMGTVIVSTLLRRQFILSRISAKK